MSDTPMTDAANIYIRTRRDFTITDHQVWQEHGEHLERELNAANERIKRLEEAGDKMEAWLRDERLDAVQHTVSKWTKAKEAKP